MKLSEIWQKHQGETFVAIVGALVGASIGSLATQHFTSKNLTRSFLHEENVEILHSTKNGIGLLEQIEGELDNNSSLIINRDYNVRIVFSEPFDLTKDAKEFFNSDTPPPDTAKQRVIDGFLKYQHDLSGGFSVRVLNTTVPTDMLSSSIWEHGLPQTVDIDNELLKELADYYILVRRMNDAIKAFSEINEGNICPVAREDHIKSMIANYTSDFETFKKEDVITLKDKINAEISRLSKLREKIEIEDGVNCQ